MQVFIGDILKQPGLSKRFEYKGPIDLIQVDLADDVEVDLKLTNVASRVLVTGTIKTKIFLNCCRCLEQYDESLNIEVNEEFLAESSPELEGEDLSWDNLSQFSYSNDTIDLYEVIRQNILAALPYKPLCSEDCLGVCPEYMVDEESSDELANEEQKGIDSRLETLKKIQEKAEENKE